MAKRGPISAYVARMESIPVWGVEMRNPAVAPLLAPFLRKAVDIGITPQEQIGSGTPIDTARIMLLIPPESPRKRITKSRGRQTAIIPAMRKPMMSQGAIIANTFQNVLQKSKIAYILYLSVIVKGLSLAGCVLLQTILLMRANYII
jgi:hypothetical protein